MSFLCNNAPGGPFPKQLRLLNQRALIFFICQWNTHCSIYGSDFSSGISKGTFDLRAHMNFLNVPWPHSNPQWMRLWVIPWWRHQMETFSVLLAFYAGSSPITGEFPSQRPVMRNVDVFFDLCLNKRLSKQSCLVFWAAIALIHYDVIAMHCK